MKDESLTPTFRTVTKRTPLLRELHMLQILITLAAGALGFALAHTFVRRRLRFVDAVHSPLAPVIAGFAAAAVAWPAAILPFVTLTTAIVFGIGTGAGTASGARALRQDAGNHRRLTP
jgi:hypothetical protein